MKFIFIVGYWVPFPSSEYGGVQVVVADDKSEALKLLIKDAEDSSFIDLNENEDLKDYKEMIAKQVLKAKALPVVADKSEIIYSFVT